jgi:glycosyltransferase involved in cell wall biosynthesis
MRVLYLVPQPKAADRIGAYSFLDEEIEALAGAGIEAFVLSTAAPADADLRGAHLRSAPARRSVRSRLAATGFLLRLSAQYPPANLARPLKVHRVARLEHLAAEIVRREHIDVIHSHFAWPQGYGGMLARAATGRPLIATLRGTDILVDPSIGYGRRKDPSFDRAVRRLLRTADRTMYFSEYMRDAALALGARPEVAVVVRKGVDLSAFTVADDRKALQAELGLGDAPVIMTAAGLIPRKGIHHILDGLALLAPTHAFTFIVCGDGPERARLEAQAERLGLQDRVRFLGRVDRARIPKYFAACDVFVLASIMEAAGNVLFEAMAAGRPIVCTNSGGPQEYVRDGETGFVVPVGDPGAMASRIGQLLSDPALADRLGAEGRRRTLGEFDYNRMVEDIIGVYETTLSEWNRGTDRRR